MIIAINQLKRFPRPSDPRIPVMLTLFMYVILGISVLGFNRSPGQIAVITGSACFLDILFARLIRREWLFPLSGLITGLGLSILVNTAHGLWLPLIPVFCAIASKYLITIQRKHVYNPTLFGLLVGIFLSENMISPSPAYQWGGYSAISIFIITAAISLFVFKIKRNALIITFLIAYSINLLIRAWLTRWHVPPETILLGTLTSPAFYLFTFFMITDPATSPQSTRGQIFMGCFIAALDLYLHTFEMLSTLFKSAFIYFTLMWTLKLYPLVKSGKLTTKLKDSIRPAMVVGVLGSSLLFIYSIRFYNIDLLDQGIIEPSFHFEQLSAKQLEIDSRPGNVIELTDQRIQHIAKWLLSIGDSVAVADVNNDGLQDFFLTYPLKHSDARAALYLNKGNFHFERFPLSELNDYVNDPQRHGLPSGALWFDYDNDADADLLLLTSFGKSRLLHNDLHEIGKLMFRDVGDNYGINHHTVSVTANALDVNNDGFLDVMIGNAMPVHLSGYTSPVPFSVFNLPKPMYHNDRRMYNFMHRSWHNANNGGENQLLLNTGNGFTPVNRQKWGLTSTRWTLDIGTGDLNKDGWTDLYLANDFGPDELLLNHQGQYFETVQGSLVGELGRDTYKGMNASIADFDNNGFADIYVSNVHQPLQAEGSMMWLNSGDIDSKGADAFRDVASGKNALNENRFGWGAAVGDLDRDGKLDILQANGMVDDSYDPKYDGCPDYWYWNAKIALTPPEVHGYADTWADLRGRCIFPNERNRVYINRGDYFVDIAKSVGWDIGDNARGIALVDLDNDGDLDALVSRPFAPLSIYRNHSKNGSWLGLKLIGDGQQCNRDAIGTQIAISYSGKGQISKQFREVVASNGFSAQGDSRILFGLNQFAGSVSVTISWCGSKHATQQLSFQPNRYYSIEQTNDTSQISKK